MAVIQIDFSDVVEVSCYSGVLTRPARHVNVVADNGVQARRNWAAVAAAVSKERVSPDSVTSDAGRGGRDCYR